MSDEATSSYGYGDGADRELVVFWPGGTTTQPLVDGAVVLIGRGEDCALRVDHRSVSRHHAKLTARGRGVTIQDLGSANGTRLAGDLLQPSKETSLEPGRVVEMGGAVLMLRDHRVQSPSEGIPRTADGAFGPVASLDKLVDLLADSTVPVIITGETGVGKEVWARRLHTRSRRVKERWIAVNCAAIPESLVESELFGHEKGAFTGATHARSGMLEDAGAGTVFLDEIADLPLPAQAKLLRAVESHEVVRLGSSNPRPIRARFVSATHQDLTSLVASGRFRADLYFRLNGMTLRLAPLRERKDEIPKLAAEFIAEASRSLGKPPPQLSGRALAWLLAQPWPGNVRELKNRIECACLFCQDGAIQQRHLATGDSGGDAFEKPRDASRLWAERDDLERNRILEALASCDGNQTRAAEVLGISRRTLINRLDAYGVERPRKKT